MVVTMMITLTEPCRPSTPLIVGYPRTKSARVLGVKAYAFSFTVRSFFTDFTPGTCQTVQDAWALVIRRDTSPLSYTTPALVWARIPARCREESFAIFEMTRTVIDE